MARTCATSLPWHKKRYEHNQYKFYARGKALVDSCRQVLNANKYESMYGIAEGTTKIDLNDNGKASGGMPCQQRSLFLWFRPDGAGNMSILGDVTMSEAVAWYIGWICRSYVSNTYLRLIFTMCRNTVISLSLLVLLFQCYKAFSFPRSASLLKLLSVTPLLLACLGICYDVCPSLMLMYRSRSYRGQLHRKNIPIRRTWDGTPDSYVPWGLGETSCECHRSWFEVTHYYGPAILMLSPRIIFFLA